MPARSPPGVGARDAAAAAAGGVVESFPTDPHVEAQCSSKLDDETLTVLDGNVGELDGYRMQVGEATVDEGECEGLSETWFEAAIIHP